MRSIVLACLFSGLSVCLGVAHSGEQKVPPTPPANSESNWRENSKLTLEQKKLLEALSAETLYRGQAFGAVVWDKAGSVLNLSLDASSRLGAGSPSQQVVSFLSTYGALWHINKADLRNRLLVVDQQTRGECSSVTLQLQEKGQRVFNATLHFSLTSKGRVRSVTGFMDARPTSFEVGKATLSRAEAMHALLKQMSWPDEAATFYRNPVLVQLDPYFLSGEAHRPVQAYLFATDQGPNGGFVINGQSGSLAVQGLAFLDTNLFDAAGTCESESDSVWSSDVVVDPLTHTPAWVSFKHFGGVKTDGSSAEDRVLKVMSLLPLQRMFGDARPGEHLHKTGEWVSGATTTLRFEQYYAGFRVEGAYLRAVVIGNKVQELFARLPYFPDFDDRKIGLGTARDHARSWYADLRCASGSACRNAEANDPIAEETVVFSAALFDQPGIAGSHLAYKFRFEGVDVWWDAVSDQPLRSEGRVFRATPVEVWNATGMDRPPCANVHDVCLIAVDMLQLPEFKLDITKDGIEQPPLHPDSKDVKSWMETLDGKLITLFGWNSVLGDGGVSRNNPHALLDIIVGMNIDDGDAAAAFYIQPQNDPTKENLGIALGTQVTAPDVLGHEFGHHITNVMYGPLHDAEQGALAESYSDIIGIAAFPDPTWNLAAASRGGATRNMLNPTSPTTHSGATAVDNVSQKTRCDPFLWDCTYVWLGIPNRAFALIASGVPSPVSGTQPLGLETAAQLYFETVRDKQSAYQMEPIDRFLNQRIKVLAACTKALDAGPVRSRIGMSNNAIKPIKAEDCENVGRAFDSVGVVGAISSGFDRFDEGATSGTWSQTVHQGARLFQGCGLSGHVLNVEIRDGVSAIHLSRSATDTPPLWINVKDEVTVEVVARCGGTSPAACPDPMDRAVTYNVDAKWTGQPRYVWVDEQLNVPTGQSSDSCLVPSPGDQSVLFWSTPIVHIGIGRKEDRDITPNVLNGSFVAGTCRLLETGGVDIHSNGPYPPAEVVAKSWDHGVHGFTVSRTATSPFDYAAKLHTWTDVGSQLFARVVYRLAQPPGASCAFPGLGVVPP